MTTTYKTLEEMFQNQPHIFTAYKEEVNDDWESIEEWALHMDVQISFRETFYHIPQKGHDIRLTWTHGYSKTDNVEMFGGAHVRMEKHLINVPTNIYSVQ